MAVHSEENHAGDQFEECREDTGLAAFMGIDQLN